MDADERDIYHYVKSLRPQPTPARDISRRVGGKRKFHYNAEWVQPVLLRMVERGILETNHEGAYHLKPVPRPDTAGKRWVTPEIGHLLQASGKGFHNVITPVDEDDYYDKL